MKNLFNRFEVLEDPRDIRGKRHELINILVMTIYGILCGLKDFANIADFLKIKEEYFKELLDLKNGTPSHDCLSDVFAIIDSKRFMEIFVEWINEIVKSKSGRLISVDGKAIRNARDAINKGNVPYIVSAFLSDIGISIGEIKVDDKSNEITAIPELLDLLEIEGATITIDAIGTQEKIIKKIKSKKAHYVLKVKDNQKVLEKDIKKYFNNQNNLLGNKEIITKRTIEKDGRIEERKYYLTYNTKTITNKRKWDSVKAICYVRVYRTIGEETSITDNYYIADQKLDIDFLSKATRSHWQIENALHWKLDVIMSEDNSRNRVGHSIENLSAVRKIVFNLASLDKSFGEKVPLQRKLTRYMLDFKNIENLIFSVIPSIS